MRFFNLITLNQQRRILMCLYRKSDIPTDDDFTTITLALLIGGRICIWATVYWVLIGLDNGRSHVRRRTITCNNGALSLAKPNETHVNI